jgi:hypothetical protein
MNSKLIEDFHSYMKANATSERHQHEKLNVYFSEIFSLPSLIKLYRMSILLFIPINKPTEIINSKSSTMVASTTVELLV